MTLKKYHQKRKFADTPEPEGAIKKRSSKKGLEFVVQRHDASHLHFDLRLELDGVMKSWAVPKGPSMDPSIKRLAVMVEDHPISYNKFHGVIPKGNYGAGTVEIWDKGTYHSADNTEKEKSQCDFRAGLQKGHFKFVLEGGKLKGAFNLVRFKDDDKNWLLIKDNEKEGLAAPQPINIEEGFHPLIKPMLATLVEKPFDNKDYIFEIKWDGYRAVAEVEYGEVQLYSRNFISFKEEFSSVVKVLAKIKDNVIFDGEIVAYGPDGKPSFQLIQDMKMGEAPPWPPARSGGRPKLEYVIFDILYLNGKNLMNEPLIERKKILKEVLKKYPGLTYSEHIEEKGVAFFDEIVKKNLEGMMAKRKDSPYLSGARSQSWLKIKHHNQEEGIICGFTAPRGSRSYFGAMVLGQFKDGKLTYIGHTGTGFSDAGLKDLYEKMIPLKTNRSPFDIKIPLESRVTWIKPKLVAQLKFAEWTSDHIMRQPVFLGLREDKPAHEVVKEKTKPIKEIIKNISQKQITRLRGDRLLNAGLEKGENELVKDKWLKLSNLEKIYFPEAGLTKGDVIHYYEKISPYILPYLKDRPESLNRFPDGIHGFSFFQKDFTKQPPQFADTIKIHSDSARKNVNYIICNNAETLLYIANLGSIEINPWASRRGSLDYPDYAIFDLDPHENTFDDLIKVAQTLHAILKKANVPSYIKTSGKSGLHIYVPMGAKYTFEEVKLFAELIVTLVNKRMPDLTSLERHPANRGGKIYLDYLQNNKAQTVAAPYSLRPTREATVSTPLKWSEVKKGLSPKQFTIKTIFPRLKKYGDIWKDLLKDSTDLKKIIEVYSKIKK